MANPGYVRSTDGSNLDNGSTWALANADVSGAVGDSTAGDRIWVSQVHSEATTGAINWTFPGTISLPNQLLCGDDAAQPPSALATSATATATGAVNIAGFLYARGLSITAGLGVGTNQSLTINSGSTGGRQLWELCNFILGSSGSGSVFGLGPAGGSTSANDLELIDCGIKFGAVGNAVSVTGRATVRGGSALSGGTSPTNFLKPNTGEPIQFNVDGFDFSNWSSSFNLILGGAFTQTGRAIFRRCTMPAAWSGSLLSTALTTAGLRAEMYGCGASYQLWVEDYAGSIKHETTIVRSGGASDGTTALAWKMATSANAGATLRALDSPEIVVWNSITGSAITVAVEVVHDSQGGGTANALLDSEAWIEVFRADGTKISDGLATVIASPADQASSSETWTTTGLTTPVKQKLTVSFTPTVAGLLIIKVSLGIASKTMYVCPKASVS